METILASSLTIWIQYYPRKVHINKYINAKNELTNIVYK